MAEVHFSFCLCCFVVLFLIINAVLLNNCYLKHPKITFKCLRGRCFVGTVQY